MVSHIPLTQGKVAVVDDDNYEYLMQWKWFYDGKYATAVDVVTGTKKRISMHRLIIGADKGDIVDHADRDRLNNQRGNLRICNYTDNARNRSNNTSSRSKYKGVSYKSRTKDFESCITLNGKYIYLGRYKSEEDAAYYYNKAAKKYFGEFAALNCLPNLFTPSVPFSIGSHKKNTSSIYRGVLYDKQSNKYASKIGHKGKKIWIGLFETERMAAEMYNVYAVELHGDKAKLNTFDQMEGIING